MELAQDLCQTLGIDDALDCLGEIAAACPGDGTVRAVQGRMLYASGRREQALAALSAAATLGSDIEILELLAKTVLPGPGYPRHLAELHVTLRPKTYLEIGVFNGESLSLARPGTRAIGIDPFPRPSSRRDYIAETSIHPTTSDAYFSGLGGRDAEIDLAFIDGLHLFEQVLRDFINVERHCHAGSVVVLHDTLPVAPIAAARDRSTTYWCGDVWKMLPCLRRYRPDLQLLTIPTYPSGLTLVRGLDRRSRVLARQYEHAVGEWITAPLPAEATPPAYLGDIANDPDQVRAWLRPN